MAILRNRSSTDVYRSRPSGSEDLAKGWTT